MSTLKFLHKGNLKEDGVTFEVFEYKAEHILLDAEAWFYKGNLWSDVRDDFFCIYGKPEIKK